MGETEHTADARAALVELADECFAGDIEAAGDLVTSIVEQMPYGDIARRYVWSQAQQLDQERAAILADGERMEAASRQLIADAGSNDAARQARAAYYLPRFQRYCTDLGARLDAHHAAFEAFKHEIARIAEQLRNQPAHGHEDHGRRVRRASAPTVRRRTASARRPRERRARRARGTRAGPDDDSGPAPAPHHARRRRANRWHSRRRRSR